MQIGIVIENHIFSYYYHWCCGFMFSLLRNPFPSLISNTINFTITIFLLLGYEHCIGYRIYVRKYKISRFTMKYIFGFYKGMFLYPYCIQILIRRWFLRRWIHHVLDIQTIPWIFNIIASKTCQGIAHNNAFFRSHYYCMSSLSEKYLPLVVSNNLFPIMIYNSSHMKG